MPSSSATNRPRPFCARTRPMRREDLDGFPHDRPAGAQPRGQVVLGGHPVTRPQPQLGDELEDLLGHELVAGPVVAPLARAVTARCGAVGLRRQGRCRPPACPSSRVTGECGTTDRRRAELHRTSGSSYESYSFRAQDLQREIWHIQTAHASIGQKSREISMLIPLTPPKALGRSHDEPTDKAANFFHVGAAQPPLGVRRLPGTASASAHPRATPADLLGAPTTQWSHS